MAMEESPLIADAETVGSEVAKMSDNRCGCARENECVGRKECSELMCKLRKVDFAIYDTVLYLDVYPDCVKAQEFYQKLICEREELCRLINSSCGPVTFNNVLSGKWNWTKGPWPWEPDAN